ncbi:MAG: hypothetical protein DI598_15595 [Pseudopedobacter saltans]|uniref:Stationary phase survival protein SurE n=1 Tax=Pseudopedobacter saltans TaxID=151895 RepID=A0A2W5EQM6_9SPHI|nr:MAG: hypothetical protein DI598_15595 [Pseudopedobacter saltans]
MFLTKDNFKLGLVLGMIAPFFGVLLYYLIKFAKTFSFGEFLQILFNHKPLVTAISSFSLLANAIIFTLYINTRKDQTAKGIFTVTCFYAVIALILKLFIK